MSTKEILVYMFIVEYYSALETDEILPICDNMDGTQGYYAE